MDLERRSALASQCIKTCKGIIDGNVGLVEGVRKLVSLGFKLECENDQPFLSFSGIDSQSDHYPLGEFRETWEADALAREDADRLEFERDFKDAVIADCHELIERFGKGVT